MPYDDILATTADLALHASGAVSRYVGGEDRDLEPWEDHIDHIFEPWGIEHLWPQIAELFRAWEGRDVPVRSLW